MEAAHLMTVTVLDASNACPVVMLLTLLGEDLPR